MRRIEKLLFGFWGQVGVCLSLWLFGMTVILDIPISWKTILMPLLLPLAVIVMWFVMLTTLMCICTTIIFLLERIDEDGPTVEKQNEADEASDRMFQDDTPFWR